MSGRQKWVRSWDISITVIVNYFWIITIVMVRTRSIKAILNIDALLKTCYTELLYREDVFKDSRNHLAVSDECFISRYCSSRAILVDLWHQFAPLLKKKTKTKQNKAETLHQTAGARSCTFKSSSFQWEIGIFQSTRIKTFHIVRMQYITCSYTADEKVIILRAFHTIAGYWKVTRAVDFPV